EQFYTWIKLPLILLSAGVSLNAIGVFMAAVFDVNRAHLPILMAGLGTVITVVALAGGAFAVLASDFVQMFLIVTITVVVAALTLAEPQVGGLSGLVHRVPSYHFHWTELEPPGLIVFWIITQI